MKLNWAVKTIGDWRKLTSQAPISNWMQTWPYAQALWRRDYKKTRIASVEKDGDVIAVMYVQEIKLGPVQIVEINRGPIWIKPKPTLSDLKELALEIRREFPKRWLQSFKWLPEWPHSEKAHQSMLECGFKMKAQTFETIIIDITPSEEDLRKNLEQKWRNSLNKAEKSNLNIKIETSAKNLAPFLTRYNAHKFEKRFVGPSAQFIAEEFKEALNLGDASLLWCYQGEEPIAGLYIFTHGTTATYRVGWNTEAGRKANAHYVLLWETIKYLKKLNVEKFDLGGILSDEEPGLTHFKMGLGGEKYKLLNFYQ